MKAFFFSAATRGTADHGWLKANYSFSFSNYHDPTRIHFGELRVLNDDTIAPNMGFGTHPHSNMEIITIPLSGSLRHRDNMGNESVITAGEVQVMSAGTGIEHAEHNASKTESLNLLQIWVFADKDGHSPRYDQKQLPKEKMHNQFFTFLQPKASEETVSIHQNAYFSLGEWDKEAELNYSLFVKNNGVYAFLIAGEAEVAGQALNEKDAVGITQTENLQIAVKPGAKLLLLEVPMR